MSSKQTLVLAFSPFCAPTGPPLGVSLLKGYLEQNCPAWNVRVVDLNLRVMETMIDRVARGFLMQTPGPPKPEHLLKDVTLSRALDTFCGKHPIDFYERPDRYSLYATLVSQMLEDGLRDSIHLAQVYENDLPNPGLVHKLVDEIMDEQPSMVGISICYSWQVAAGLCFAKALKLRKSDLRIVCGGTYFSCHGKEFLQRHGKWIDCIVRGEGEKPLEQLLNRWESFETVPGLVYQKDGQIFENEIQYETNLDGLGHPDYSDLDPSAYLSPLPVLPVLTSRGCYWRRCTFCVHYSSAGQTYRVHSPAHIVEQLENHVNDGHRYFAFIDEMISPAHFSKLADAIIAAGLDIDYYALAKPTKQFTPELLAKMRKSGCRFVLWGLESGCQRIVDLMDKGTHVEDMSLVFRASHEAGIFNHVYVLVGFPTETLDEFKQTLHFLNDHRDVIACIHKGMFYLEKGSPVFNQPERFRISRIWLAEKTLTKDKYAFECSEGMSREEVLEAFQKALPFMKSFHPYSNGLGNYRNHALLIYANQSELLDFRRRVFPALE